VRYFFQKIFTSATSKKKKLILAKLETQNKKQKSVIKILIQGLSPQMVCNKNRKKHLTIIFKGKNNETGNNNNILFCLLEHICTSCQLRQKEIARARWDSRKPNIEVKQGKKKLANMKSTFCTKSKKVNESDTVESKIG
jgi:hypothetical protein